MINFRPKFTLLSNSVYNSYKGHLTTAFIRRTFCQKQETFQPRPNLDESQYEQEWTNMYLEKQKQNREVLDKKLTQREKQEVELVLKHVLDLNKTEKKYYLLLLKQQYTKKNSIDPLTFDSSSLGPSSGLEHMWPKEGRDWTKSPHLQTAFNAFSGKAGGKILK